MSWQKCRCGLQVGPAHIIFLNHYTPFDKASDQYKWAVADLADAFDRARTPWLLAVFHAPVYNTCVELLRSYLSAPAGLHWHWLVCVVERQNRFSDQAAAARMYVCRQHSTAAVSA